jgi:hypothetical protein
LNKTFVTLPLLAALAVLALAGAAPQAWSQTVASAAPAPRAQVKMDRDEFLRTHRWDPLSDVWSLNPGMAPPAGVMPRADVMAARETYLSTHRWDDARGWRPLVSGSRNLSALTRDQVRLETRQFMRTHRWDETTEEWLAVRPVRSRGK